MERSLDKLLVGLSVCPKFTDFAESEALRVKIMAAGDTYLRIHNKSICFYILKAN